MKKLENKNEKHQTFDVNVSVIVPIYNACLLYTSDAADE